MGWKLKRIELAGKWKLKPNEERDITICLEEENRAAIHGVVKFPDGCPVKDAVVKLFERESKCKLKPITFAFTDECGQFLFGVDSCKDYVIKVFFYHPEHMPPSPPPHCKKDDNDCDY